MTTTRGGGDDAMGTTISPPMDGDIVIDCEKCRVKALGKDKWVALEAFGSYVESMAGDTSDNQFLKKALRGVRTIICSKGWNLLDFNKLDRIMHQFKGKLKIKV